MIESLTERPLQSPMQIRHNHCWRARDACCAVDVDDVPLFEQVIERLDAGNQFSFQIEIIEVGDRHVSKSKTRGACEGVLASPAQLVRVIRGQQTENRGHRFAFQGMEVVGIVRAWSNKDLLRDFSTVHS